MKAGQAGAAGCEFRSRAGSIIADCELPTWILVFAIYGGWMGLLLNYDSLPWWILLPAGGWFVAWHNSFQHEAVHGHPSRHEWLNELLAWPPLGLWLPYPVYRDSHRVHHETSHPTDPHDDPESWYVAPADWERRDAVRRAILMCNNSLAGRVIIGPWLAAASVWTNHLVAFRKGERRYLVAWTSHLAFVVGLLATLWTLLGISPLDYLLFFALPGLSLSLVRSFYEHRPAPALDGSTAIVEAGPLLGLLFLNNNLHVVHHDHPGLPWYTLPAVYRRNRRSVLARTNGFIFRGGYLEIARRFGLRPKDMPRHPGYH